MTTEANPFAAPATPSPGIQWEDQRGRLLLIEPHSVETGITTIFGEKEAVRADVTIIDADGAPEEHQDTLIFGGVLISQTRSLIGQKVLGRLGQGNAKPGQKPPWRLDDPTPADIETGKRYLASRTPANPFTTAPQPDRPPF